MSHRDTADWLLMHTRDCYDHAAEYEDDQIAALVSAILGRVILLAATGGKPELGELFEQAAKLGRR